MDRFNITAGTDDLELVVFGGNGNTQVIGWFRGASAWTIANYANLPKYTIIHNCQDHKTYEKTGAAGTDSWVASAARS